jgi:hypothetical protein
MPPKKKKKHSYLLVMKGMNRDLEIDEELRHFPRIGSRKQWTKCFTAWKQIFFIEEHG